MSLPIHRRRASILLLLAGMAGTLRAGHIQSFQLPENVLGQVQFNAGGVGSTPTAADLYFPQGAAVDPISGKLFISDTENNRILRYSSAAALITGAAAEAVLGQPDFTSNGHAVTPKELYNPAGLAFDASGRLWVADSKNNRVLRFDSAATKPTFSAMADGVLGQANLSSSASPVPPTQSGMSFPIGIATDANGTLWVGDAQNARVLRFDNAATKANGANADGVLGAPVFTTDVGLITTQYSTTFAEGLATDAAGTLWVADAHSHRVLRFDHAAAKANGALADGLLGQSAYDSSIPYSPPTADTMSNPVGVAVDANGALWVADAGNNRVLRFDHASSKALDAPADAVLGQKDFTSNFSGVTRAGMYRPSGVALAASGDLFVTETQNNRALRFTPKADPPPPSPTPTAAAAAPPILAVTGKKILHTSQSSLLIKGSASSAEGISRIEYRIGKGSPRTASGTTAWRFKAALKPGKNTITILAVSNGSQTSATVLHLTRD